jgi:hypothetical protein
MQDSSNSQTGAGPSLELRLKIVGIGNVPSFKNTKKIITIRQRGKKPRPSLITDPKKKAWMEEAIGQLESQLRGWFQIAAAGMPGAWLRRWQTVSSALEDDSIYHMLPGEQRVRRVAKGEEGCEILIELMEEE